jgi:hypothetical protein
VEPNRPIPTVERAAPTTTQPEKRTDGQPSQQFGVWRGRGRGRIPPVRQSTRISVPSNRYPAEEWTKSNPTKPESPYRMFMFHHSVYCCCFFLHRIKRQSLPRSTRRDAPSKKKGIEKDML